MFGEILIDAKTFAMALLIVVQCLIFANSQCQPDSLIQPCYCTPNPQSRYTAFSGVMLNGIEIVYNKSIVCEQIDDQYFDLRAIFAKLSTVLTEDDDKKFDAFLLINTRIRHLPENVFGKVTFLTLSFHNNTMLSSIDVHAFTGTRDQLRVFQTMNTNLSDADGVFTILRQFHNLQSVEMHNDRLESIPDYAFNHTRLRMIQFGDMSGQTSQPLMHVGKYPFYDVPNLISLYIFSPFLTKIGKYALAQGHRPVPNIVNANSMLYIHIGGPMLNSNCFEPTSLTRFRGRSVFLRLFRTSINYFDELIFQPFLETGPSSLLSIEQPNVNWTCDCRSEWIRKDYCDIIHNYRDARVYGPACCYHGIDPNCKLLHIQ